MKKNKVLLVEDDNVIQIVHSSYLLELGCEVDVAKKANDALALIHKPYDIIFVDMGLPDMDGALLVKEFRKKSLQNNENADTPIIAITGYDSVEIRRDFEIAGTNDIIIKPVFLEQLDKILQRYCTQKNNVAC